MATVASWYAIGVACDVADPLQFGWTSVNTTLRLNGTLCISARVGSNPLRLETCDGSADQEFAASADRSYVHEGWCVDIWMRSRPSYRPLDLYGCHHAANQQFQLGGSDPRGQQLISGLNSTCVAPAAPPRMCC